MELWNQFVAIADGWKLVTLVVLIAVVLVLGVINALLKGQLRLSAIADIARKRIVPGVGGYYILCIAGAVDSTLAAAATAAFGVVVAVLIADILAGLKELGVPFPLPEAVSKFLTAPRE